MNTIFRWPELWLTPLIGLVFLVAAVYYRGLNLYGSGTICVLAGVVPLAAVALLQRLMASWRGYGFAQAYITGIAGGLAFGYFYYGLIYPGHFPGPVHGATNLGDLLVRYFKQAFNFVAVGGTAGMVSGFSILAWRSGKN